MIQPASRVNEVQEYYFSRKLKEVAKMNADGQDIISLAIGSPDMPPSEQTIDKLCEVARETTGHGYQPTAGTAELRSAMAGFYKRWYGVAVDAGTEVVPYDLREDNGWQPDFETLEKMDLSRVRLMWTNYPNMPTGGNACRATYEHLVDFACRHGIVVVNDNPYSFILNEGEKLSLLQVSGAKDCCIEFNSMSKAYNMPGWRVGMCISNPTFISWILKVKSNIDSGTFRGIQLAAAEAMNTNTAEWHQHNIEVYRRRRVIAEEIMTLLGCRFDASQTGMFLWGRIPEKYADAEQLTERILHEARVFVTPGFIFGSNGRRYVRISLCAKDEKMAEACNRIAALKW